MNSPARSLTACSMCGAPAQSVASRCSFCGAAPDSSPRSVAFLRRSVSDAVRDWAHGVQWAPRRMDELVTGVSVRDEVIERTAMEVVSRTAREERAPCRGRQLSGPRIATNDTDLFSMSLSELRAATEHVSQCSGCNGSAVVRCRGCRGSGRASCSACNGSGKTLKHYKKSSRLIQCKVCRASGTVRCGSCGGDGSVKCAICIGSGQELAWLVFDEQANWRVRFEPMSPIVTAHPVLREPRFVEPSELGEFGVETLEQTGTDGASSGYSARVERIDDVGMSADPKRERIRQRQRLRLAVVRRDATYEMCGVRGTLVCSGKNLLVAKNREALAPIRLRRSLWVATSILWVMVSGSVASHFLGQSQYYATMNSWIHAAWFLAVAFAVPTIGATLRAFRPRLRFGKLSARERLCGVATALAFVALPILRFALEPRLTDLVDATAKGRNAEAHQVLDALRESTSANRALEEADDGLRMLDSQTAARPARIVLLDAVAQRAGSQAERAKALARGERLAEIRELGASAQPLDAVAAIDRWFREVWPSDPELRKERAFAFDRADAHCQDELCSLQMRAAANATESTTDRVARERAGRLTLLGALQPLATSQETAVDRLRRYRRAAELAQRVLTEVDSRDEELSAQAERGLSRSREERHKTALVGSTLPVAEELMQVSAVSDTRATWLPLRAIRMYLALDAKQTIRGVYVVGSSPDSRAIRGGSPVADELLSQSTGRAATVKRPTGNASVVQTYEAGVRVVTRWNQGELIEMRIGMADP